MKKILAVILLLCIVLTSFGIVSAQEAEAFPDEETRSVLIGLGIVDEADFENVSDSVTRKEAAKIAVRLMGIDGNVFGENPASFPDVAPGDEYAPYIKAAKETGLIQGDGDGNFRPDDAITLNEYSCILVRALGYYNAAESLGGFMEGYYDIIRNLGMFKGISADGENSKANIYIMTANILEENLLDEIDLNNTIEHGRLMDVIMERKDLITGEGVVYGNEIYPLTGGITEDESRVKIGDEVFLKGETDVESLLGKKVRYFAKKTGLSFELTFVSAEDFNETLILKGDSILSYDANVLTYEAEDEEAEKIKIESDAFFLVNKRPAEEPAPSDLTGRITLINNDDDKSFEAVFVDNSTTHKITDVDAVLGNISFQKEEWYTEGDLLVLMNLNSSNDGTEVVIRNSAGERTDISALKAGDVVDIAFSNDKKYISIQVNENKVSGKITMTDDELNLTVEDTTYGVSVSSAGVPDFDKSYLNSSGTFYINSDNEIVYYEESANSRKYAYVAAFKSKASGLSDDVQIKLVLPGGIKYYEKEYEDGTVEKYLNAANDGVQIFDFAKSVRVDNAAYKREDMKNLIATGEIIEYKLNSDGEIKTVNHPVSYFDGDSKSHYRMFTVFNDAYAAEEKDKRVFSFSGVNKGGFRVTTEDTAVFCVPPFDDERYTITGDANYSIGSDDDYLDRVRMNNGTQYYTRAYEFDDEDGIAYVFAIVSGLNSNRSDDVLNSTSWSVLTDKRNIIDENGDSVYKLKGYTDGKPFDVLSQSGDVGGYGRTIADLREGDVFKYTLNTQERIYSVSDRSDIFSITADIESYNTGFFNQRNGNIYGKVVDIKRKYISESTGMYETKIWLECGDGTQVITVPYADNGIYYFDISEELITVASQNQIYSELETGADSSWIYAKLDSSQEAEVVVIVSK